MLALYRKGRKDTLCCDSHAHNKIIPNRPGTPDSHVTEDCVSGPANWWRPLIFENREQLKMHLTYHPDHTGEYEVRRIKIIPE